MIDELCPKCNQQTLIISYGLMGGGIGVYEMCDDDKCGYFKKEQDKSSDKPTTDEGCFHG